MTMMSHNHTALFLARALLVLLIAPITRGDAALAAAEADWPVTLRYSTPNAVCGTTTPPSDIFVQVPSACNPTPINPNAYTSHTDVCVSNGLAWQSTRYGNPNADPQVSPNARNFNCSGTPQSQDAVATSDSGECLTNGRGQLDQNLCYTPGFQQNSVWEQRGNYTLQFQYYTSPTCDESDLFQYRYLRGTGDCRQLLSGGSAIYRNNQGINVLATLFLDDSCSTLSQAQAVIPLNVCTSSDDRSPLDDQIVLSYFKLAVLTREQVEEALPQFATPSPTTPAPSTVPSSTPHGSGSDGDDDDDDETSGANQFFVRLSAATSATLLLLFGLD